jgi:hypothetical protein
MNSNILTCEKKIKIAQQDLENAEAMDISEDFSKKDRYALIEKCKKHLKDWQKNLARYQEQ